MDTKTRRFLLSSVWLLIASNAAAASSDCVFTKSGDAYVGSCGSIFNEKPVFTLQQKSTVVLGIWRSDMRPTDVWDGTLSDGEGKSTAALEVYAGGFGVLRTGYGWYAATGITQAPNLHFTLDATQEIKPNDLDRKIIVRAAEILATPQVWNRADNRICPDTAKTWSIYCAMDKATAELSGAHDHRRPAAEVVREVIEDLTVGRNYDHRLMDYNNDPATTIADVQGVFRKALGDATDSKWLAGHGFATADAM